MEPEDYVGISEIADLARVSRSAVANWRQRFADFPEALLKLQSGPVFRKSQIRKWLKKRKGKMSTIISTINLKGGVGKTTTTVAMAEFLAVEFGQKVLVIDLDPQTNATTMLIGERRWKRLNDEEHTLARLFKDALEEDPDERKFDIESTLQRSVSNVRAATTISLLPSSLDLIDVQDRLASMPSGRFYTDVPTDILRRATRNVLDEFDYVLIDCPPNLGIITLNGLRISDFFVIPTIPDVLSTYGIPQILSRVQAFAESAGEEIQPLGIIVTKFRQQSTVHVNTERQLRGGDIHVFEAVVPESDAIAGSAEFRTVNTLRQKYGYQGQYNTYLRLIREVMDAVEQVHA